MIRMNLKNCTAITSTETITAASCSTCADGEILLDITGDNAPFKFNWDNGQSTNPAINLLPAEYSVTVTDNIGCIASFSYTLPNCTAITSVETITAASCSTCADGEILLDITGDNAPFTYNWDNGQSTNPAINLLPAQYNVTVTDNMGCNADFNYTVDFLNSINKISNISSIYPNPTTGIITLKNNNSTINSVQITDITGKTINNYTDNHTNSLTIDLSALPSGVYFIKIITDNNTEIKKITKK